jgi:CDP-diacylglycerol--serine O-phosphatidyltransferase
VSFGVVPGLMLHSYFSNALVVNIDFEENSSLLINFLPYFGFLVTLFSALRLAKFNNDTRQSDSFIGLPTPANTILIASISVIIYFQKESNFLTAIFTNFIFLIVLTIGCSLLLVAELPLFALKFKNFSWYDNKLKYAFLLISLGLIFIFKFIAIPLIILVYVALSIVNNIFLKPNH